MVSHRTLTESEPIFSNGNFLPSDKITNGEILEKENIKFLLAF